MDLKSTDPVDLREIAPEHDDMVIEFEDVTGLDDPDLAEARADIAAGRVVPNSRVVEWIRSWGTGDELPVPDSWRK